jgi:protocatechuate 3,4-dioxygenase beta subunit
MDSTSTMKRKTPPDRVRTVTTDFSNDQTIARRESFRGSRTPRPRTLIAVTALCLAIAIVSVTLLITRDDPLLAQRAGATAAAGQSSMADIGPGDRDGAAPGLSAPFTDVANLSGGPNSGGEGTNEEPASRGAGRDIHSDGTASSPESGAALNGTDEHPLASSQESSRELATRDQDREDRDRDTRNDPQEDLLSISGSVLDDFGEPVPGLEITAVARSLFVEGDDQGHRAGELDRFTMTQFDGTYAFVDLADGEYDVSTLETASYSSTRMLVRAGSDSANLLVTRHYVLLVRGTVTDRDGRPLAGVRVLPFGHPVAGVSDDRGRFEVRLMTKSNSRQQVVRFDGRGYQVTDVRLEEADWQDQDAVDVSVVLQEFAREAEVSGTVTSATGAPVSGETIQLNSPTRNRHYFAVTDQRGSFSLPNVEVADDYLLWIRPKQLYRDYGESSIAVTVAGVSLNIVLEPVTLGRLSGRMFNLDGDPIPHFTLWLRSAMAAGQSVQLTSDARGYYAVHDVPLGALILETRSFPIFRITGVHSSTDDEQSVDVVLDRGDHAILGRVMDSYGSPVSGAEISLHWHQARNGVDSRSTRRTVAEMDGYFALTQLGAGWHTLDIRAPGYRVARVDHQVGANEREIEVLLEETP